MIRQSGSSPSEGVIIWQGVKIRQNTAIRQSLKAAPLRWSQSQITFKQPYLTMDWDWHCWNLQYADLLKRNKDMWSE